MTTVLIGICLGTRYVNVAKSTLSCLRLCWIIKKGIKKNKSDNLQIFKCKDCKRKFTTNFGFEKKQNEEYIITGSLEMYFSGMSVRDISRQYRRMGIKISHMTIYRWIASICQICKESIWKRDIPCLQWWRSRWWRYAFWGCTNQGWRWQ